MTQVMKISFSIRSYSSWGPSGSILASVLNPCVLACFDHLKKISRKLICFEEDGGRGK